MKIIAHYPEHLPWLPMRNGIESMRNSFFGYFDPTFSYIQWSTCIFNQYVRKCNSEITVPSILDIHISLSTMLSHENSNDCTLLLNLSFIVFLDLWINFILSSGFSSKEWIWPISLLRFSSSLLFYLSVNADRIVYFF